MTRPRSLRRLFRLPASEDGVVTDVSQEIAFHIEERTQALIARGMDPSAARAAALREFGDVRESRAEAGGNRPALSATAPALDLVERSTPGPSVWRAVAA